MSNGKPNCAAMAAVLTVSDIKASRNWYVNQLGFSCEISPDTPRFAIAEREACSIMLSHGDTARPTARSFTGEIEIMDVYIWVRDIKAIEADLKTRGTPIAEGPVERFYGCTEIAVHDPDGFRIVFGYCP